MKIAENKRFLIILTLVVVLSLLLTGAEVVFANEAVGNDANVANDVATVTVTGIDASYFKSSDSYSLSAGSYELTANIMTTKSIIISGEVTLDLNGFVIDGGNGLYSVITVEEDGILNLCGDESTNQTYNDITYSGGLITGGNGTDYGILRLGQTSYNDKDYQRSYFGGGILVKGELDMSGGTISGIDFAELESESTSGRVATSTIYNSGQQATISALSKGSGAVAVDGGTFNMTGGEISGNANTSQMSSAGGGGVYVFDSSTHLQRAPLTKNGKTYPIYYDVVVSEDNFVENPYNETISYPTNITGGTFNMSGGKISGNTSTDQDGGGVFIGAYSTLNMTGGTISNNEALNGGGVYSYYAKSVKISDEALITENTATECGAGVYSHYSTAEMTGGTISSNDAESTGGGVFIYGGTFSMSGGEAKLNTAHSGGGVEVYEEAKFYLSDNAKITNNEAILNDSFSGGGGVDVRAGTMYMTGGTVSENTSFYGGGIQVRSSGYLYMSGGIITENTANDYAGGMEVWDGTVDMSGGRITRNYASRYPGVDLDSGALYVSGTAYISENYVTNDGVESSTQNNVVAYQSTFAVNGEMKEGANIGIGSTGITVSSTSDYKLSESDARYFVSNVEGYKAELNGEDTMITMQELDDYEIEITPRNDDTFVEYFTTSYTSHNCGKLSNTQPIFGVEVYDGIQYYIIGEVDTAGEITGVEKVVSVLETGNYYLADNLNPAQTIKIESGQTVSLCLNGKIITGKGNSSVITILGNGTLNLYDCSENTTGKITGGNASYGGGINGASNSRFNMYGGNIDNNTATVAGGGIYSSGIVYIYGGTISENEAGTGGGIFATSTLSIEQEYGYSRTIEITGNTATSGGGGIYSSGSYTYLYAGKISDNQAGTNGGGIYSAGSTFKISYSPVVTGNHVAGSGGTKTENNLYMLSTRTATIGTISNSASIGLTKQGGTGQVVQTGNADVSSNFSSDNSNYVINTLDGYIYLAIDISSLNVTDNNGDVVNEATTLSQTTIYNGKAQTPTVDLAIIETVGDQTVTTPITAKIEWFTNEGCTTAVGSDGMINAGTYYGKITGAGIYAGTASSNYVYTIEQDELQIIMAESVVTYNGEKQAPSITVKGAVSNETITSHNLTWNDDTFTNAGEYSITAITAYINDTTTINTNFKAGTLPKYTINKKSLTSSDISYGNKDDIYEIESKSDIDITVTDKTLETSLAYDVAWQYSASFASGATFNDYTADIFTANGVYVATIAGIGNYKDSVTLTFKNTGDNTMPIVKIYESYASSGTALSGDYFSRWQGANQTFVFYAEDDKNGDNSIDVVGMDHATLTISASGSASQSFEFEKEIINQTTFGEGYLDIATGIIYLKSYDSENANAEYYANATDSSDERKYSASDIDTSIHFKATVITTGSVGDTEILTALTFNPASATIYNIAFNATDANGNTSTDFGYNESDVASVTLSIDPRIDTFNKLYEDIFTEYSGGTMDVTDENVAILIEYFKGNSIANGDIVNLLEAYSYYENQTSSRQARIAGVDVANGVTASNEISDKNYTNLMKMYSDDVYDIGLALALKKAKEAADSAYEAETFDLATLKSAIDTLETAYNSTLIDGEMDSAIKSALATLIGNDTSDKYAATQIDDYIEDITDYITAKSLISTLEATPTSYLQLSNIINAWKGMDDNTSIATNATQQAIAEKLKIDKTSTFAGLIVSNTDSYAEIKIDIDNYEKAIANVQSAITLNNGDWNKDIREDIKEIIDEYQYAVSSGTGEDSSDYNLTTDTIKFLQITTVSTIETWIENITAIENVESLIEDAKTSVNNPGKVNSENKYEGGLFIYNTEYIAGLEMKEYLIDTAYVVTSYEVYIEAQIAYDALVKSNPELAGVIAYAGTTAQKITINGPTDTTGADTLVDVLAKFEAITVVAKEEAGADKYTDEQIENSIEANKMISALDASTSTVYDILYADYLYDNLGVAQDLIGATSTNKLVEYVAIANAIYNGDFASTQSGGVIDENNIAFDGYHGHNVEQHSKDYIVGKIYDLAVYEYNSGDLSQDEADAMIKLINQEIVEIIYGATSVVEYEFNLSDSMDRYSQTFFNIHHIFPVGNEFYYVHDVYRSETGTYAGFWDFGSEIEQTFNDAIDEMAYNFTYDTYSETLTDTQQIIMNSVGTEYDYLVSLFTRLMEAHIAANNLPEDVLGDCEGEDHTVKQHYESVEIAKMALERLSTEERRLLGEDLTKINKQYEALLVHMASEKNHGVTYEAQGDNVDGVSVFGLATQVDLSVLTDYDKGVDPLAVYVSAYKYPEIDSVDISGKTAFDGLNVLNAYNIKLIAKTETEEVEVQPSEGKKVVVIIPIQNDTLLSSITLYHIEDTGANAGAIEKINDKTYFTENGQLYLSFTTTSFSDFVLIGDKDPDYVAPKVESAGSGSSGVALDTHNPIITVDGEIATITDANLAIVKINGESVEVSNSTMVIDLAKYGNGTHEIYAADKYGRFATETVVVSSIVSPTAPTATETPTATVTPTQQAQSENSNSFPWWILIVIAVCVTGYIVYKKNKNK